MKTILLFQMNTTLHFFSLILFFMVITSASKCNSDKELDPCDTNYAYESVSWIQGKKQELNEEFEPFTSEEDMMALERSAQVVEILKYIADDEPVYIFKLKVSATFEGETLYGDQFTIYDCSANAFYISDVQEDLNELEEKFIIHDGILTKYKIHDNGLSIWEIE